MPDPIDTLAAALEGSALVRYLGGFFRKHPDLHMKDLTVEAVGPDRQVKLAGRWVVNFGSDSFLGLDQDPRRAGRGRAGAWTGGARTTAVVAGVRQRRAERARPSGRSPSGCGTEAALIYPSVTLANLGALPGLVTRHDVRRRRPVRAQLDRRGAEAREGPRRCGRAKFAHNDPAGLERCLHGPAPVPARGRRGGRRVQHERRLPPLAEFRRIADAPRRVLYVDDAHATGVLGGAGPRHRARRARATTTTCWWSARCRRRSRASAGSSPGRRRDESAQAAVRTRSSSAGRCRRRTSKRSAPSVDILASAEYPRLRGRLDANVRRPGRGRPGWAGGDGRAGADRVGAGRGRGGDAAGRGSSCSSAGTTCSRWCSRRCRTARACSGCR